ncbi:DUF1552 domain-containing protein [Cytobacillus oceanisediminis]|uniref:DUF1552 domain-containing protein n=1 Tax=Cytobacillus oceanisediminis TaxID=665099 RepID=UPI001C22C575|nr:DUF1552 domain-containing protein [Cytobacillus oceanisediminis]MBU8730450.1 DUF1552 domain-containing protein [Cytobacillus oceanisediminis]
MSEKLFTQDEVNEIIKERLAREKKKLDRELEEVKSATDTGEQGYKAKYLDALKEVELRKAGIPYDKVDGYMRYLKGKDADEIKRQVAEFASILDEGKREEKKSKSWNPFGN